MAKFTTQSLTAALKKIGWNRPVTPQDLANANKYGFGLFQKTQARMDAGKLQDIPQDQPIPSYDEFLRGGGSSYANLFSPETLSADYDPYFNKLSGAEDYQKGLATEDLNTTLGRYQQDYSRNVGETQQSYGEGYSGRGLFGSGIYQQELGKALDSLATGYNRSTSDLNQAYQREYGSGNYSGYNQRKFQIEQDRLAAIQQAKYNRQRQALGAYQQQYHPAIAESYY